MEWGVCTPAVCSEKDVKDEFEFLFKNSRDNFLFFISVENLVSLICREEVVARLLRLTIEQREPISTLFNYFNSMSSCSKYKQGSQMLRFRQYFVNIHIL